MGLSSKPICSKVGKSKLFLWKLEKWDSVSYSWTGAIDLYFFHLFLKGGIRYMAIHQLCNFFFKITWSLKNKQWFYLFLKVHKLWSTLYCMFNLCWKKTLTSYSCKSDCQTSKFFLFLDQKELPISCNWVFILWNMD
jgi:hypothetical protein